MQFFEQKLPHRDFLIYKKFATITKESDPVRQFIIQRNNLIGNNSTLKSKKSSFGTGQNRKERKHVKRIAILIAHLGNGGAERVSVNLANGFQKMGHEVHMIVFHTVPPEYYLDTQIKMHYLEGKKGAEKRIYKKILNLRKMLYEIQPDAVIELGFAIKYILMGGLLNKYNYILSMRNDPAMWNKQSKSVFKYFRNYYFGHAKYVVFQTEDAKNYFKKKIRDKGVVIPNMIKEDLPAPFSGEREKVVTTFCRLNLQKNIPMMLKAFKIFSDTHPEYLLKIYGRGEEEENLKQFADSLGIAEKVQFCGFNSNVHEAIKGAMMYVNSSDYEGISNAMLEALGIGLPTICTDCPPGGARMFIRSGENGFLVPVGDHEALAESMGKVADDAMLRDSFSKESIKIKDELALDAICKRWADLI